jgi:hypothetical protein
MIPDPRSGAVLRAKAGDWQLPARFAVNPFMLERASPDNDVVSLPGGHQTSQDTERQRHLLERIGGIVAYDFAPPARESYPAAKTSGSTSTSFRSASRPCDATRMW